MRPDEDSAPATRTASPTALPAEASTEVASGEGGALALRPTVSRQIRDAARYEILGEHGRGGLGRVARARDRDLGRDVAIKELIVHDVARLFGPARANGPS